MAPKEKNFLLLRSLVLKNFIYRDAQGEQIMAKLWEIGHSLFQLLVLLFLKAEEFTRWNVNKVCKSEMPQIRYLEKKFWITEEAITERVSFSTQSGLAK